MFSSSNKNNLPSQEYNPLSLDEFSDDDDDDDINDIIRPSSNNKTNNLNNYSNDYNTTASNYNNTNSIDMIQQQHRMMLQQQDDGLDILGQHVEKLGSMSLQIHNELYIQNTILDTMDDQLDNTTNQLHYITQKTKDFIQANGGTNNICIIISLGIIVIILFFLILYT